MRKNYQKQMPLTITSIDHPHAEELEGISQILDANPIIYQWILQDLTRSVTHVDTGAEGMSAEQVRFIRLMSTLENVSDTISA